MSGSTCMRLNSRSLVVCYSKRDSRFAKACDPHPLAPCALLPEKNDEGKDLKALRKKVAEDLSKFPGRVISIEGRPFLNLADYLAWQDARAASELKVEEGFSAASFNSWFERQSTEDVKLAGIYLSPVFSSVRESVL